MIEQIENWHRKARPNPDDKAFNVQLGCHFEEIAEMLASLEIHYKDHLDEGYYTMLGTETAAYEKIMYLAEHLKNGKALARITDRKEFLDSVADQVVTGVGAAWCAYMDSTEAIQRVNASNWSKYDEQGNPIFNEQGKIAKGPRYHKPDLTGLY